MSLWKEIALSAYYHTSLPARGWRRWRARRAGRAPVMIVFYHRVADHTPNDWTISTTDFVRHVRWLSRHFDLVPLGEAQRRLRQPGATRPAVCITFDDGYADNMDFALPLLARERIPYTYFVTWGHVQTGRPFAHDLARNEPLRPNSIDELRQLAGSAAEIGCHTRWHPDLGQVDDPVRLADEVVTAGRELAAAIGQRVRYFAFPFGLHRNLNATAFSLARDAGYEAVCSAYGGYNFPGDDDFHLQRIHADPGLVRLKNWLSVDPRKLRGIRRFEVPSP